MRKGKTLSKEKVEHCRHWDEFKEENFIRVSHALTTLGDDYDEHSVLIDKAIQFKVRMASGSTAFTWKSMARVNLLYRAGHPQMTRR